MSQMMFLKEANEEGRQGEREGEREVAWVGGGMGVRVLGVRYLLQGYVYLNKYGVSSFACLQRV
jgi:hypothetical protein